MAAVADGVRRRTATAGPRRGPCGGAGCADWVAYMLTVRLLNKIIASSCIRIIVTRTHNLTTWLAFCLLYKLYDRIY